DYLIVGSGTGGATMAYRLSCSSSSVLVIERGPRYSAIQDFNDNELEMIRKLYKEGGLQQTKRFDLTILQGECVGGSTVINNAICFRMPKFVQDRWTNHFDIDLSNLQQEYDAIGTELEIGPLDPIAINTRVEAAFRGGVSAVRFLAEGRRATGVMLRTNLGNLKTVKVRKAVIAAGGVIASSHFLMRSGVQGNVGQRASCNFAFPVAFDFPGEMRAFDG